MTPPSDVLVDADITVSGSTNAAQYIERDEEHAAHTYHPLPVVLREGSGVWVTDVDGRRYLDCLAGYSALNFGHSHPTIVAARSRPTRAVDLDEPRVPSRPARVVLRRARRAVRHGDRAADEQRRRSG